MPICNELLEVLFIFAITRPLRKVESWNLARDVMKIVFRYVVSRRRGLASG
jgi:hypothetical protein